MFNFIYKQICLFHVLLQLTFFLLSIKKKLQVQDNPSNATPLDRLTKRVTLFSIVGVKIQVYVTLILHSISIEPIT